MKTLKQRTMTMALFGLLAANSGWNLMNKADTQTFANATSIEGQISLAMKSTSPTITLEQIVADKRNDDASQVSVVNYKKKGYIDITIDDVNKTSYLKWLQDPARADEGMIVTVGIDSDGDPDWLESSQNQKTIKIRKYTDKKFEKFDIDGVETTVVLDVVKAVDNDLVSTKEVTYKAKIKTTEGSNTELCEKCYEDIVLPVDIADIADTNAILAKLKKELKRKKGKKVEENQKLLAKTCESKKYENDEDKQLECLVDMYEGKSADAKKIDGDDKSRVKVLLSEILTEEYKDDARSDEFDDFFRSNPKFKKFARKVSKEARAESAREEKLEREEERTEMMSEALEQELDYIEEDMYALDEASRQFESMLSYANRDLDQMKMNCDMQSGIHGTSSSRNYFGNTYSAGLSFNNRDGFNTYAGNTRTRSMTTMPAVNQIGGNNQYAQWQAQWDQMNRQNAQMMRDNCMMNVQSSEQYYNWELANYEDNRVKPLESHISSAINKLDVNRIFPTVYKSEDKYNGGIQKDDKEYFAARIKDFQTDFGGMGSQARDTSVLYNNSTPSSRRSSINTNNNSGSRGSSLPASSNIRNNGRFSNVRGS